MAPNGYISAALNKSPKLSLDEPSNDPGISVTSSGKEIRDFFFDVSHPLQSSPQGKLGERGKRIEAVGKSSTSGLEATLAVEVHDEFPNVALVSATVRNATAGALPLDQVDMDTHRFSASRVDPAAAPNQLWSFHGASIRWGKDNVFEIPKNSPRKTRWVRS